MPGGAVGVQGAVYQQRYVAFRLLSTIASRHLSPYQSDTAVKEFQIEGRTEGGSPIWDVHLRLTNDAVHLRECKDAQITREDRLIFYRRVRKEIASGTSADRLFAGWVTDPDKQDAIVGHLRGMAALLEAALGVPSDLPSRVQSAKNALNEALYCLCSPNADDTTPCSVAIAAVIIKQLSVDEHRMAELQNAVRLLGAETFDAGTGQAIDNYICGTLSTQIAAGQLTRDTIDDFLTKVGTGMFALNAAGTIRDLIESYSGLGPNATDTRHCIRWSRLPNEPTKTWRLVERLPA